MKCVIRFWEVYRVPDKLAKKLVEQGWQYTSKQEWKDAGRRKLSINATKRDCF
mgnify:CR=1 FL=1